MNYTAIFEEAVATLRREKRYRVFAEIERIACPFRAATGYPRDGPREIVIWCSNDYLGMAQPPASIAAMAETAKRVGVGAGGTRNISGTSHPVVTLEDEIADLHGKEAALVFTSGYVSNQA